MQFLPNQISVDPNLLFLLQGEVKMAKITFSASVALATELMEAIVLDGFENWINARVSWSGPFSLGGVFGPDDRYQEYFLNRIHSFASTLKDVRITEITLGSMEVMCENSHCSADNTFMTRKIDFHLGNEEDESQVVVTIFLEHDSEDESPHSLWGSWRLNTETTVRCSKHPDPKCEGIILGLDVVLETDA